jgi:predicted GNAT superfamily acetyltransferase
MIEIHKLSKHSEFAEAVRIQQEIWGYADVELLPLRLFVVAEKIGGQVLGAFDDGAMVGFCLGIPGLKPGGKYYLHSHMLGVLPPYRNSGLGRQLKLKQREDAIERGIDLIEWTFDPLELKNAYFNIERLGAIVRRFVRNQYGSTSSHLHGGLPTDRCTAEWWINSKRVHNALNGEIPAIVDVKRKLSVPTNISQLRTGDPELARRIQSELGDQLDECFSAGLAITRFEKTDNTGDYLLSEWHFE